MKAIILSAILLAGAAQADGSRALPDSRALPGVLAQQAYHAMAAFVATSVAARPTNSVVLIPGEPLVKGEFVRCAAKPLTVIVALDAAVRGDTLVPGAGHAIGDARKAGVKVIFTTDRPATDGPAIAKTLTTLNLGPVTPGDTLLTADAGGGDARRLAIAAKHCVIAAVGTHLSDFSDRFAEPYNPRVAVHSRAGGEWGKGWFLVPAPSDAR